MLNKEVLTKKQERVYRFIKAYLTEHDEGPTRAEIAKELGGKSIRTVGQYLDALQSKGLILRDRYAQRSIRLVEDQKANDDLIRVPVFASAGCGDPSILADRIFNEYTLVSSEVVNEKGGDLYAIRAVGRSMVDAGIQDGDLVLVKKTEDVSSGDKVVAIIGDTAVIKKIEFADTGVILYPMSTDSQYHSIILKDDSKIFGKVVEVLKIQRSNELQYDYDQQ